MTKNAELFKRFKAGGKLSQLSNTILTDAGLWRPIETLITGDQAASMDEKWFIIKMFKPSFYVCVQYKSEYNNFFDWQVNPVDVRQFNRWKPIDR